MTDGDTADGGLHECPTCERSFASNIAVRTHESRSHRDGDASWRDEDTLRELYYGRGLSMSDIAEKLGCTQSTVRCWMERHGIERRGRHETQRKRPAHFRTHERGYEKWVVTGSDSTDVVLVHRLLAVAEYGFEAVRCNDIHHVNRIPWDNRPSNIEVLNPAEHRRLHIDERAPERDARGRFL